MSDKVYLMDVNLLLVDGSTLETQGSMEVTAAGFSYFDFDDEVGELVHTFIPSAQVWRATERRDFGYPEKIIHSTPWESRDDD